MMGFIVLTALLCTLVLVAIAVVKGQQRRGKSAQGCECCMDHQTEIERPII